MAEYVKVGYQVATYKGEVEVPRYDENEENEVLFARAEKQLSKWGGLPFGYRKFWLT